MARRREYNRLKVFVTRKKVSREELAELLEKDVRTITRYLANEVQPSIPDLFKVAERIGVDARELIVSSLEPATYIEE